MAVEDTNNDGVRFRCDHCNRHAVYWPNPFGPTDESARVAGWRIGGKCYCPACAGTDLGYWDDRLLAMAREAGFVAGSWTS